MAFRGIPADAFAFLRTLAAEQNKPWFEANRARYEASLRAPVASLIEALAEACARRDVPLTGDAKRSGFRIHRDVRFSKDKAPYKTHAGMVLFRQGGSKEPNGVLYVHLEPGGCFAACAFYRPDPPVLNALRAAIARDPAGWAKVEAALAAAGLAFEAGEPLTRLPRGHEAMADSPVADALKRRSHTVRLKLTQAALGEARVVDAIADFARDAMPLLRFGWAAIDAAATGASRLDRFLPGRAG